jgi:hypothetical protein
MHISSHNMYVSNYTCVHWTCQQTTSIIATTPSPRKSWCQNLKIVCESLKPNLRALKSTYVTKIAKSSHPFHDMLCLTLAYDLKGQRGKIDIKVSLLI